MKPRQGLHIKELANFLISELLTSINKKYQKQA